MGQILDRDVSKMMYDANAWRRLSLQYLNSLWANGEQIEGQPTNGSRQGSRPGTPPGSRRSSFGSRGDIQHSFRGPNRLDERPVLQEYEPTWKNGKPPSRTGSSSRETDFPPIDDRSSSNHRSPGPNNRQSPPNRQNGRPLKGGQGDSPHYADIIAPNRAALPNVKITPPQDPSRRTHFASSNRGDTFDYDYQQRNGTSGRGGHAANGGSGHVHSDEYNQRNAISGRGGHIMNGSTHLQPSDEQPGRTHSPKSTSTWENSTDEYNSSNNSDPTNQQSGHYDSHSYLSRYGQQHTDTNGGGGRIDNSYQQNGTSKYYQQRSGEQGRGGIGIQTSFNSRQSSGRGSGRSGGGGDHYIPYRDYYIDRKLRGETGPNSYSDFSGYSRNSRRRPRQQISYSKWIFIGAALGLVASTIWNSVYLHFASKNIQLGYNVQGRRYSMSDTHRHLWEGFIIAAQVVANLASMLAIYAALMERYWIIWSYTWLMFLYGMFGAVTELTRGSYTSWIMPGICGLLAITLTHQIAISRKIRSCMST